MKTFCIAIALALPALAQEPVRYELSFPNAAHHEVNVRATFSGVRQPVLEVVMSRSSPGRYALHEFAKNVYSFSAHDPQGNPLEVVHTTPYQWNVAGHKGTVVVDYTVFGDRADGTYLGVDPTHAHLSSPATFAWARGLDKNPIVIKINAPDGSRWKPATQMPANADGTLSAANVDTLMDSPIELSAYTEETWTVGNSKFRLALHHSGTDAEAAAYAKAVQAITAEEEGVFGAFPKYDNGLYTFLLDYLPYVSGDGMEHRNSTSISNIRNLSANATDLLGTVAHEFFHSWNVERIRPKSLEPFDFERADMSGELWFAEGFTNYYGQLALKRAGLWSVDRFSDTTSNALNQVLTRSGPRYRSVVEMSQMAPFVDAASPIDVTNFGNTYVSYYTFGQSIALGVDLSIRAQFPGKSLDDWMRAMGRRHPDVQKTYTIDDQEAALAEVTSAAFAANIFRQYIRGKEPMDYQGLLARAGFQLSKTNPGKGWVETRALSFGAKGADVTAPTYVGAPLYNAGIDRGDKILEWDGKQLKSQKELETFLEAHKPGDRIKLKVETRAATKDIEVTLGESPELKMVANELAGKEVTPEMKAFRESWLSSKAVHPQPKLVKYCHTCHREHPFEYEKCPFDGAELHITPKS